MFIIGKKLDSGYFVPSHSCHAVLDCILTTDEICVYHDTPETKSASMGVGTSSVPEIEEFTCCDFCWHKYGHRMFGPQRCVGNRLHVSGNNSKWKFILRGTATLKSNHKKRRGLFSKSVLLLHDNNRPHWANATRLLLQPFRWEIFNIRRTAPSQHRETTICFLLKDRFGRHRFQNDVVMKRAMLRLLQLQGMICRQQEFWKLLLW